MVENLRKVHLSPVLSLHNYCQDLDLTPGKYVCQIHVVSGDVQLTRREYDLYSGTFDFLPEGEPAEQIIHDGEDAEFSFTVGQHSGQPDEVAIANRHYLHPSEFFISYRKTG